MSDRAATWTSNHAMELTAPRRHDLDFGSLNPHPIAMHLPARGSASRSR
jgi:hypothetical protein